VFDRGTFERHEEACLSFESHESHHRSPTK
jgi:hypothetical protein